MFLRTKRVGKYIYLQIVENSREGPRVRQRCVANLGRFDELIASGALDSLADSATRIRRISPILKAEKLGQGREDQQVSVGPELVFRRLWSNLGFHKVLSRIKISTQPELAIEKIIYNIVLDFLLAPEAYVDSKGRTQNVRFLDGTNFEKTDIETVLRWLGSPDGPGGVPVDQEQRRKDLIEKDIAHEKKCAISSLVIVVSAVKKNSQSLIHNSKSGSGISECNSLVGVVFDQHATLLATVQFPISGYIPARWSARGLELCKRFKCNQIHLVIDASIQPNNYQLDRFIRPLGGFSSVTVLEAVQEDDGSVTADFWTHLKPDCRVNFDAGPRRFDWQILTDGRVGTKETTVIKSANGCSRWLVEGNSYDRWFSKNENQTESGARTGVQRIGEFRLSDLTRVVDTVGTVELETMALIYTTWHLGREGVAWILESIPVISRDDSDNALLTGHLMVGFLALRIRMTIEDKLGGYKDSGVSWSDVRQAIVETKVYSVVQGDRRVLIRNDLSPLSVNIFRSIGVAVPQKLKECDVH